MSWLKNLFVNNNKASQSLHSNFILAAKTVDNTLQTISVNTENKVVIENKLINLQNKKQIGAYGIEGTFVNGMYNISSFAIIMGERYFLTINEVDNDLNELTDLMGMMNYDLSQKPEVTMAIISTNS